MEKGQSRVLYVTFNSQENIVETEHVMVNYIASIIICSEFEHGVPFTQNGIYRFHGVLITFGVVHFLWAKTTF